MDYRNPALFTGNCTRIRYVVYLKDINRPVNQVVTQKVHPGIPTNEGSGFHFSKELWPVLRLALPDLKCPADFFVGVIPLVFLRSLQPPK